MILGGPLAAGDGMQQDTEASDQSLLGQRRHRSSVFHILSLIELLLCVREEGETRTKTDKSFEGDFARPDFHFRTSWAFNPVHPLPICFSSSEINNRDT